MNKRIALVVATGSVIAGCAGYTILATRQANAAAIMKGEGDVPKLRNGLWDTAVTRPGAGAAGAFHSKMCVDAATQQILLQSFTGGGKSPCTISNERHVGAVYTSEQTCNFYGKVTHYTHIVTYSGDTGRHSEQRSPDGRLNMTVDMHWLGSCPAGMKPGDVTGPDGKVVYNLYNKPK